MAASAPVTEFLINAFSRGNELRDFIESCIKNPENFEKSIKKKDFNFFPVQLRKKNVNVGGKIQEDRMQRDLFGQLLVISLEQKVDLEKILSFPLTPMPLSMCHVDATICKTDKSVLTKLLEKRIESSTPPFVDVTIIDGFFLLHLVRDVPLTFEQISKSFLNFVLKFNSKLIILAFDVYKKPSIKDTEHALRNCTDSKDYQILGKSQKRTIDFTKELKNLKFKEAIVKFFVKHWKSSELVSFYGTKTLMVNFDVCYQYEVKDNVICQTIVPDLSCSDHEEADTKIIFHAVKLKMKLM